MRESYMRALGSNLVLRFDELKNPLINDLDGTPEEIAQAERRETEAFYNNSIVAAQREDPHGQNVYMLQAELIRFLIRQIKRKNKKVVVLTQYIYENQEMSDPTVPTV